MSDNVVRSDAACCPAANRAAYSASPALATTQGIIYNRREDVNGTVDPGGVIVVAKEEDGSGDGSGMRSTKIRRVREGM